MSFITIQQSLKNWISKSNLYFVGHWTARDKEELRMKKADIKALIESATDDQDINEIILGHDEFKDLGKVDLTKLSTEDFNKLVTENATISGYYKSKIDSAIGTAITTHDKKFNEEKLPKIIEEELKKKSNENKTPTEIALDEVKAELERMKTEKQLSDMVAKYQGVLTEKKIPIKAIELILGKDEETTDTKIALLEEILQPLVDEKVMERLGTSSYEPPAGGGAPKIKNPWAKETFNLTEQAKILRENPELAKKLKAMAGK